MSECVGVLGATGAIGTGAVNALDAAGYAVSPAGGPDRDGIPSVDVRDRSAVNSFVGDVDVVVNAAGLVGIESCRSRPDLAYAVNATGGANVAWVCRKQSVPLVHLSTVAAIGDPDERPLTAASDRQPTTIYGRTKLCGERAVETLLEDRVASISLSIPNVYGHHEHDGPGENSVLDYFVDCAVAGEALTVYRPGTQQRDFVHVRDVADAIVTAVDAVGTEGETAETGDEPVETGDDVIGHAGDTERSASDGHRSYLLGSGTAYSILELAGLVAAEATGDAELPIELRDHPHPDQPDIEQLDIDSRRARSALGFTPVWSVQEWISTALGGETVHK